MKKLFANGDIDEFMRAVEKKKAVLMICKTNKSSFGFLILDPIIIGASMNCSLICAFNIKDRKAFKGDGEVFGSWDSKSGKYAQILINKNEISL
jgi:hypothetical protein